MAKNFGKFVLATAVLATAGAAAYYYLQKKDSEAIVDEDYEDYDDFKEPEKPAERSYVNLTPGAAAPKDAAAAETADAKEEAPAAAESSAAAEASDAKPDSFTPLEKVAQVAETVAEDTRETVEEFFDDEDPDDEEPAVSKD